MKLNKRTKIILSLIFVFITVLVSAYLLFKPYTLVGVAMAPSYKDGQINLSNKLSYIFSSPKRGDIVIFEANRVRHFKRIIALPDERVKIENGEIYINGSKLEEPYLNRKGVTKLLETSEYKEGVEFKIPSNEYFILGDNRSNSLDSRSFGTVSKEKIKTKLTNICITGCKD